LAALAEADAAGAETARSTVVVAAAFRAVASLTPRAAEQIVATVALRAGAIGDGAGLARFAAAGAKRNAFVVATFLALAARAGARALDADFAFARAIGIVAAFLAGAAAVEFAALQAKTAFELLTGACVAFGDAKVRAFAQWHAFIATAFLTFQARGLGKAGAIDACAAAWAFIVGAALAQRPAIVCEGAAILARGAPGDALPLDALAADGHAIGISAAFRLLADARVADLAPGTSLIAAAIRTVVLGGTQIAALLSLETFRDRSAMTGFVADGGAAFIFGERVAVHGGAALWRALPVTANPRAGRIACLRAGLVQPGGQRHSAHQSAKQPLERRSARASSG
jgi:hypothetical protein